MFMKEHSTLGKAAIAAFDSLLVIGSYYLAWPLYAMWYRSRYGGGVPAPIEHIWLVAVFVPVLLFLCNHYGLLQFERSRKPRDLIISLVKAFVIVGVVLSGVIFLTKAKDYPRPLLATNWLFASVLVAGEKLLVHRLNRAGMLELGPTRMVALVGEGPKADHVSHFLRHDPGFDLPDAACFDLSVSFHDFQQYLVDHPTDELFFVLPRHCTRADFNVDRYLSFCERLGIPARVILNMDEIFRYFDTSFGSMDSVPFLIFHPPYLDPDRAAIKRLVDVVGAGVGLLITAAFAPIIALAIRLDSRGPVFFSQERVGQNGRRFRIHKFRTMVEGADQAKDELADENEMEGPMFKIEDDPRVTRVGRWLRKLSLDELPQFWNVLKGEMSLVGTRPPTPEEVDQYELWHYRRISIRPGITGMWQVSGRNEIRDFQDIVQLDLKYIDEWSLWLDLKILALTLVRFATGK